MDQVLVNEIGIDRRLKVDIDMVGCRACFCAELIWLYDSTFILCKENTILIKTYHSNTPVDRNVLSENNSSNLN